MRWGFCGCRSPIRGYTGSNCATNALIYPLMLVNDTLPLSLPLQHWSLLRFQFLWAFNSPLPERIRNYPYYSYPIAAWLLSKGSLTLRFPSGEEHYRAGEWIFPKSAPGQQIFSDDAHLLSIRFYAEWPNGKPLFDHSRSIAFPQEEVPLLTKAGIRLAKQVAKQNPSGKFTHIYLSGTLDWYIDLQPIFTSWIMQYYKALSSRGYANEAIGLLQEPVRRCLDFLRNRPLTTPFREKELAEEVGLSVSQINKLFAQEAKTTPSAFWNHRRLTAAQSALIGSDESVKAIAFSLGFFSSETFSRWFHAQTGYCARTFRSLGQAPVKLHETATLALKKSRKSSV